MTNVQEFEKWLACIPQDLHNKLWFIPVKKNDKKPDVKDSWLSEKNRLSVEDAKKRLSQGLNVAFVAEPTTLCVVDLDLYKRPDLKEELFKIFPLTLTVETPSGGQHRYYRQDGMIKNADGKNRFHGAGEVRANRKYVLVPGSEINGKLYTVKEAIPPAMLSNVIIPAEFKPTITELEMEKELERAQYEEFENRFGWTLADILLHDIQLGILLSQIHPRGYPSPSEADMATISKLRFWEFDKKTIFTIMMRFRRREKVLKRKDYLERTYVKAIPLTKISNEVDVKTWHPNMQKLEEEILKKSARLRDGIISPSLLPKGSFLREYLEAMQNLTDAYPEYHFGCALVALSATIGRNLEIKTIPQKKFANVWILLIGASTYARKTTALELFNSVLEYAQLDKLKISEDFSPEAFIEELADNPHAIYVKDELADLIVKMKRSYGLGIDALFAHLYSCPASYKRRLRKKLFFVESPYLCVLAATVPETFAKFMDEADIMTGFLPRFLILMPERAKKRNPIANISRSAEEKKMELAQWLHELYEFFSNLRENNKVLPAELEQDALDLLNSWCDDHYAEFDTLDEIDKQRWGTIFGRLEEYAQKLACLVRISRAETRWLLKPQNIVSKIKITQDDMKCAIELIDTVFYPYAMKFLTYLGAQTETNIVERVALLLQRLGSCDRSTLLKKSKLKAKDFEEALDTLQKRGDVRIIHTQTRGRMKERICWVG